MAAIFNKPKRNFRRKAESADSDNENTEDRSSGSTREKLSSEIVTVAELKKAREKKKKDKSNQISQETGLLSFAAEEDEPDLVHIKKSSHSKKVVKDIKEKAQQEKEEQKKKRTNTQVSKAGEYSKDKLKELKDKQADTQHKQEVTNGVRSNSFTNEVQASGDDIDQSDFTRSRKHDPFKSVLQTGLIPDAHMIHAIRKKRQLAREQGEFIPLDDTVKHGGDKSRLIRDDENDLSDDEDVRINFVTNTKVQERQNLHEVFLATEQGSDKDDSDQDCQWEEQQIRKGVSTQQVNALVDVLKDQQTHDSPTNDYTIMQARTSIPQPVPIAMTTDLSKLNIETVKRKLQDRLVAMTTVHRAHEIELGQLTNDTTTTQSDITSGQGSTTSLEERYKFFQEVRGYVRDVIACLNEKVPRINLIESRYMLMQKSRAVKLTNRRQQDIKDQFQDYSSTGKAITDPVDPTRQQRTADREARRGRRRRLREKKSIVNHDEGLSSDDEENLSDMSKFKSDSELLKAEISGIFDDAIEDYRDITEIRSKFEEWKFRFNDSYKEAYISLCLPKLLNPLIRVQLIMWNPLKEGQSDIETHTWFKDVAVMGCQAGIEVDATDDNIHVLPGIVEKIILPKLTEITSQIWDPLSVTQTCRLVNFTQKLIADYPTVQESSKQLHVLLKAVVTRIRKTLDDDVFLPLFPKSVIENKNDDASVFFNRQFWSCVKLLGNILSLYGIVEDSILQQLALDSLLNRYITLGLTNSPVNDDLIRRCQTIVSTLPKPWFVDREKSTMPQLENFCRCLNHIAGIMGNVSHNATDAERRLSRERVKLIIKLFVNINAIDHATDLQEKFAVKV